MVKAMDSAAAGAGAKLDHIRTILHGTQFKGFEQKFQRQENALEKARAELRERLKAAETATRDLEQASRQERRELEKQLSSRLDQIAKSITILEKASKTAIEEVRKNGDTTKKKLTKDAAAQRQALEGAVTTLKEETTAQLQTMKEEFTTQLGTLKDEAAAQLAELREESRSTLNALKEKQRRMGKDLTDTFRHELTDEVAKQNTQTQHLASDLSARISDVDEALTEQVTTLGETMISRHALGESLVALGAQLLGAVREQAPADEATAVDEAGVGKPSEEAVKENRRKRTKDRE